MTSPSTRTMRIPFAALILVLTAAAANADAITGRASVIDADTLEIHGERIRILDIDAPESRQTCSQWVTETDVFRVEEWRCGQQASLALAGWIGARPVICETTKKDRYKRWLARCSVEGSDTALWLAENGWAFAYKHCKCEVIRAAVDRAKSRNANIWSGEVQEPWEWRKTN